jgi:glucoamylase
LPKTYFNDAITGNSSMLCCITSRGEIVRLFWPHIDYSQHVDRLLCGLYIKEQGNRVDWFGGEHWACRQGYVPSTNILETVYEDKNKAILVRQTDFALVEKDIMIRHYDVKNMGGQIMDPGIMVYSSAISSAQDMRGSMFDFDHDAVIHYSHDCYLSLSGSVDADGFQIGENSLEAAENVSLYGSDCIGMSSKAAAAWNMGSIKPGGNREFTLYICASETLKGVKKLIEETKKENYGRLYDSTCAYWNDFINKSTKIKDMNRIGLPEDGSVTKEDIEKLYNRSLLVFKLMSDKNTGGVLASAEIDEGFTRCGRYAYCWGRDAAFITGALDICGLTKEVESFCRWAARVQDVNGSWYQRYHMDGNLGPSWGLQVDETGTLIWGMLQHYKVTGDKGFLCEMWDCIRKGVDFLVGFIDKYTGLPMASFDLWEERYGEHAYSIAAVYAGIGAGIETACITGRDGCNIEQWKEALKKIQVAVDRNFWKEDLNRFIRSVRVKLNPWGEENSQERIVIKVNPKGYERDVTLYDDTIDISLLGLCVPFEMYGAFDEKIIKTVRAIENSLSIHTGEVEEAAKAGNEGTAPEIDRGIMRYENDGYIGGNPWIIATLWLALYYLKTGEKKKAEGLFLWTVRSRTELDLLPEQVDRNTGKPAWVIPLTWSHAMFVLVLFKLLEQE